MNKFSVTLAQLRKNKACYEGYNKVVRALQGREFTSEDAECERYIRFPHKEEISLSFIASSNGIEDALWATRCISGADRDLRLFAVWCARQVQHIMKDQRSIDALDVAERFANGDATSEELYAARAAARAATWDVAWDAARDAASAAARDATWDAARAAARDAAWAAASAAARDATRDAARDAQKVRFIEMCDKGEF